MAHSRGLLAVMTLALLAASVYSNKIDEATAQVINSNSSSIELDAFLSKVLTKCPCSPSKDPVSQAAQDFLVKEAGEIAESFTGGFTSILLLSELSDVHMKLNIAFNNCIEKFGVKSCVDADNALWENGFSFCLHENEANVDKNMNAVPKCTAQIRARTSSQTKLTKDESPLNIYEDMCYNILII